MTRWQRFTGQALVAAQFALLGVWLVAGPRIAIGIVGQSVQAVGLAVALWAFAVMSIAQGHLFRIAPDPSGHSRLVTWGPYRWVRHPMYLSILLVVGPSWLVDGVTWRAGAFAALAVVLVAKLTFEEHLLVRYFTGYAAYRTRSARLVPGVF
jgi:protein-S-isoprenylcysteine O-methyltransferase Ste14